VNERKAPESKWRKNRMSVLLKYYIQKVFLKIKSPALSKKKAVIAGKTGTVGRMAQDDRKTP
jgi:hypothetical protein